MGDAVMAALRDYLQLMRVSNLPTVWSNTLVGLYAGYAAAVASGRLLPPLKEGPFALLLAMLNRGFAMFVALSFLYLAGMVLNDLLDEDVDREERPTRPIPSGRVTARNARLLLAGLLLLSVLGLPIYGPIVLTLGVVLILCIVAYDVLHRRWPAVVGLMGLCRALVYLIAAAAFSADLDIWLRCVLPFAGCVLVYITLVTIVSRQEVGSTLGRAKWAAPAMIVVALSPALVVSPSTAGIGWVILVAVIMVAWLGRAVVHAFAIPPRTPQAIMTWLSGLCLLDAYFLTLLGHPVAAALAIVCWAMTAWGHRRIAGT